jgi:hypothetical protein
VAVLRIMAAALLLTNCAPAPTPVERPRPDATADDAYRRDAEALQRLAREAEDLQQKGKPDAVAALITKGEPLATRLLSVPRPTLDVMEAASDLDDLYGRMLLANGHYGWARMQFQKNAARWKNWRPQTPETVRRRKLAEERIAECDRHLGG